MADQGAEVADRSRTRSRGSTWSSPWSPMPRGDGNRRRSRMLAALPAGVVWAQMSTIGVEGTAAIGSIVEKQRPDVCSSTRPCREARFPRAGEADHLCLWDRRGAAYCRAFLRGNRATYGLAGRCRLGSRMKLVNNTLLAFGLKACQLAGPGTSSGTRDPQRPGRLCGRSAHLAWRTEKWRAWPRATTRPSSFGSGLKGRPPCLEEGDPERFTVLASLAKEWEGVVQQGLGNEDVTVVARALEN